MVECLLRRSKDLVAINKVAGKWGTALQAAINGDKNPYDTVQLLLDNGADPSIVGGWHGTPLNAAAFRHQYDVAKLLLQHLPSDKIDLVGEADVMRQPYTPRLPRRILRWPNDFWSNQEFQSTGQTRWGRLPLHMAAMQGDWEMVQLLSSSTSTIHTRDKIGRNALHFAAGRGSSSVLRHILNDKENVDLVNAVDIDGWTPLHWACRQLENETLQIIKDLKGMGADASARTLDKWTPRHVAVFHDIYEPDILKLLPKMMDDDDSLPCGPGKYIGALCDSCGCLTYDKRYKCKSENCVEFVLCFKYYRHAANIHYGEHEFDDSPEPYT
ncbi:hypothetical protein T310_6333 [Rasamsonia emersonii CBS 393.64]|uniref:Uncharacterized protein n=1 Tax=Rasamsonia emersonii (strain ATCC 16479 / CBS 393.64 / IMI 116815) TaxID=1408163 RepID=A0A0F4YN50_RASE3|nr:hypothetical protein T310_6333 [Rasamsonia emersonii CBS 393.64]KKA19677.1 hypothetical protein T310_6333 [Rasamsonia emersonii CBS 393.64]